MSFETEQMVKGLPMELVFVRHGQSEANVVQQAEKSGEISDNITEVYARHDFEHPLTERGVKQAKAARSMLINIGLRPEAFDGHFVSPFLRTIETAAYIGNGLINWNQDWRLAERDWGIYGATPLEQRRELFAHTEQRRDKSSFHTRYDGGENMPDVILRLKSLMGKFSRDYENKRVLNVAHGELMWGARYDLEGLTYEEWQEMDKDKTLRIGNCNILQYTRMNPDDPSDVSASFPTGWTRMIDPYEPERSPYGGNWRKLDGKHKLIGTEILQAAEARKRIPDLSENPH